jgi:hypothetical protein
MRSATLRRATARASDASTAARSTCVGEDDHAVVADLEEAAGDGHDLFAAASQDTHLARHQRRDERRVPWQHGELALGAGRHDLVDALLGVDDAFGRDDLYCQRHA